MKAIAVTKPDMAVLNRDRMGLSSFGVLAALFSEEILQRSQRQLGVWPPAPLDLLQEETEENMGQNAHGPINVNLDLTLILKNLREEQKKEQKKRAETIQTMEKLMERIVLREQTLRVQESTQQINIRAGGIGQSHIIQTIRTPPPYHGLEPVSEVTAVPSAGGWHPRWRQEHPGFSPERQIPEEIGNSIVLPDALRRRRQQALEGAAFGAAVDRVQELLQKDGPGKTLNREELRREIGRAVEATLAQQQGRSVQDSEFQTLAGIDAEQTKRSNEADHKRAIVKAGRDTESVRVREAPGPGHSDHRDQLIYREEVDALTEFAGQTSASAETTYTKKNQASSVQGLAADSSKQKSISTKKNISDSKSSDKILDQTAAPETWTASSSREIGFDHKTEKQAIPQGDTGIERNVQPLRDIEESELVYEEENPAAEVQLGSLTIPTSGQPSESPRGGVKTTELVHREDVPVESLRQTDLPAVPATGQPSESTQERVETTELVHREDVPVESLRQTVLPAVPATGQPLDSTPGEVDTTELVHREELPVERWRQTVLPAVPATGQPSESTQERVETTELVHREDVPVESLEQTVLPAVPATGQPSESTQERVETTELVHREEVPVERWRQIALPAVPATGQPSESTQERIETTELVHREEVSVESLRQTVLPAVPATGQPSESTQGRVETTELVHREDVPVESLEQTVLPAVPATGQPSESIQECIETTELVHREEVPVGDPRQSGFPVAPVNEQSVNSLQGQIQATELVHRIDGEEQLKAKLPAIVQMEIKKADQSKPLYQKQEDDKSFHPPMGISAKYGQGPQVSHLFVSRDIRMLHHQMIQQQSAVVPFHSQVDRPAELSYLQMPIHAPDEEGKKESAGTALPQWAQKLLEKPNGPTFRFDRYASSGQLTQPMPQETQRQIQWTAPGTVPPTPNITYHTKPPAEPLLPVQTAKLSDVELRRAADKIYHMIEERLRREMRRSGR